MSDMLQQLMSQVHALSKDLGEVKNQLKEKDVIIESLRAGSAAPAAAPPQHTFGQREFGIGAPMPVDKKIAEKPRKYAGNVLEFIPWQEKLKIFLESQDPRWRKILEEIEDRSVKPMTGQGIAQVAAAAGVTDHLDAFQKQLYQYFELFTAGDAHKMVLANKSEKSFETWRSFADKGRSTRPENILQLRLGVLTPSRVGKYTDLETAISAWDKEKAYFEQLCPSEALGPELERV